MSAITEIVNNASDVPDIEKNEIITTCSQNNYGNIYNLAMRYWKKQLHDISIQIFKELMRLAEAEGNTFYANKALNEIEIRQNKKFLQSRVRAIHITLTNRCNMACQFCYQNRYISTSAIPTKTCEEIMGLFPCLQRLVWQGGEAFLHPAFKEMLTESMHFPDIQHTLITNGMFLDEKWIELFLKIPEFHLVISIESIKKEVYAELRKGGSLERLRENINLLNTLRNKVDNKLKLSMSVIAMKKNYLEIEDIINFAMENKFYDVIISPLYPNGSEFYDKEYLSPDSDEVQKYFSRISAKIDREKIVLNDIFTGLEKKKIKAAINTPINPIKFTDKTICLAPWQQLFIEVNGEAKSYCHCTNAIGNLNNNSISEIWNSEKAMKLREDILNYNYQSCNVSCTAGLIDEIDLKLE